MEVAGQLAVQVWGFREKRSENIGTFKPKADGCSLYLPGIMGLGILGELTTL